MNIEKLRRIGNESTTNESLELDPAGIEAALALEATIAERGIPFREDDGWGLRYEATFWKLSTDN